ncbi:MAG: hypothetical protein WHT08_02585 [Bryobacteraceae bacterium]
MRLSVLLSLLAPVCLAQTPAVPTLGWIAREEPGRFQRVAGIAGAAVLDAEAEAEFEPGKLVAVRPGSAMAVSVSGDGVAGLIRFEHSEAEARGQAIEGAIQNAALAAWSPSGDALLLAGEGRMQVWRFEGGEILLVRELPLDAVGAAVSDGGSLVLAKTPGALYLIDESGGTQEVTRQPVEAFSFLAGGLRFAWVGEGALWLGSREAPPEKIDLDPYAEDARRLLASAAKGKLLLAESSGGESRLRLLSSGGEVEAEWRVPAMVETLEPTGAAGILRLTTAGAGPVWMADLGALEPAVFFVPRGVEQARQGGER